MTIRQNVDVEKLEAFRNFLSENPDVDVSKAWERCWNIHSGIVDRIRDRFDVTLHASCEGERRV